MLTYIYIDGFKSFHEFEMEFSPFTVVAGANASGKSNLFDAIKLISALAGTDNIKKAFKEQRGEFLEMFTQYQDGEYSQLIEFRVEMLVSQEIKDDWGSEERLKYTRLRYEVKVRRYVNSSGLDDLEVYYEKLVNLKHQGDAWVKNRIPKETLESWRPKVSTGRRSVPYIDTVEEDGMPTIVVPQDGKPGGNKRRFPLKNASRTVLSSIDTVDFPHVFAAKTEMRKWRFLELAPQDLRKPTNKSTGEDAITETGENLAAALHRIKQEDDYSLTEISRKLQMFLPHFTRVNVLDDIENKQFVIKLTDKDGREYSSRVLSEGTLRILVLCILEKDAQHSGLLCFEEPENGVHPYRIEAIVQLLKDLSVDFNETYLPLRQVIVNTHSPVLLKKIQTQDWNNQIGVWYADIRDRVLTMNDKRKQLSVTHINPVLWSDKPNQLSIGFSDQDKKLILTRVQAYLETTIA